jgi:maleylpyruvate isomerase
MAVIPDLREVLADCRAGGDELRAAVERLHEPDLVAPTGLPGWTRGHVLAHLANVGLAAARQAEYAARGEPIEVYDGGRAGRDAAIEADATLPMAVHRDRVVTMLERVEVSWPAAGSPIWDRPVTYRNGTVVDMLLAWWRELRIHLIDLDVSIGVDTWNVAFCEHLRTFLAARLPATPGLEIHGDNRNAAYWLAGRKGRPLPTATLDGHPYPLPELLPWPSNR